MNDNDLRMFVGALAVAYLVPGPDMLLVLQSGARHGRAHALATAAGLAMARATHVALAALGLAALLRTAPWAFELLRLAGAAYLVWLGVGILRTRSLMAPADGGPVEGGPVESARASCRAAIGRGLLTNLLNPKALLFCSVLLPQFIRVEGTGVAGQFLTLGMILVGLGIAFDTLYALAGATLGRWIARRPALEALQRWAFASLLIGFGARLAVS